jgi:CDP-diacylglycerol--glycerol-3-phosphate 3-phosphatidyltransferase
MFTPSNVLSLLRLPLALLFFIDREEIRAVIVVLAILTDCIDGYVARRYQHTTRLGAVLDPLMDKFFVFIALGILFSEKSLGGWEVFSMLSRDLALFLFGLFLLLRQNLRGYNYHSLITGKIFTGLQFTTLFLLSLHVPIPSWGYTSFLALGCFVLAELVLTMKTHVENR